MYAIVTAKMAGMNRPCRKRQKISEYSPVAVAVRSVGTDSPSAAATMTRFRPTLSAIGPMNGDASATAVVVALTVRLTLAAEPPKTLVKSGSKGCVA